MAVAARENAEVNKNLSELYDLLQIIAKNTKTAESAALAQALHKSAVSALNKKYSVRDLGVKEAPFYVLVGPNIPAVLVETGFITNEKEAERLADDAYLSRLADGLADGLANYLKGFN
ncbi:MAG: N-acetylmuramoyl-L-alanine amidase, partial [Candidatus Adiutrix sp.]|jgi:N-acetylmuramoyl-L-alanine amidase|nr:N-acetylmuramoyl-L-alanine amidase [Candidatus Adiutrix sp.]